MVEIWVLVPIAAILGFWFFLISASQAKARVRELEIRERIALIEKGRLPAPEMDPRGFERAVTRRDYRHRNSADRHRRAGVTLIGVGLGLTLLIGFASGEPRNAVGVGGFLVMLGLAFLVNSVLEQRQPSTDEASNIGAPSPPASPEPPKTE